MAKKDLLSEIQDEAEKLQTDPPDFVEIDGVKYYRQAPVQADPGKVFKSYVKRTKVYDRAAKEWVWEEEETEGYFERILINIAPHASDIKLDGRIYFANFTYEFHESVAPTIRDIMARTWDHERATGGANINMAGARSHAFSMNGGAVRTTLGPVGVSGI